MDAWPGQSLTNYLRPVRLDSPYVACVAPEATDRVWLVPYVQQRVKRDDG